MRNRQLQMYIRANMTSRAPAILLVGTIESATIEPTPMHKRSSAPIYQQVADRYEPLDLRARQFRYLLPHRCSNRRRN